MIQIYPNPYENNPPWFFGISIRNSSLSAYSYLSSIDYEVSAYNDSASQFSGAFVYRCGDPSAWAPFDNPFSVYGTGVTGVPANTYSLWGYKKEARFNYLNYGTDSTSRIRVKSKKGSINQVDIGPYKKNFNSKWSQISSDTIEISGIEAYDKLIVVTNNDLSSPLYVFANPIEVIPTPRSFDDLSSFFYVSAGIWEISALLTNAGLTGTYTDGPEYVSRMNVPSSNYTVYLAPGAYVDGSFSVRLKNNITFSGPGIIDPGRRFIGTWWSSIGFEATGVNDEFKLRYASIYGFSSFSESYTVTQQTSSIRIMGPTFVNSVTYGTSIIPIQIDNVKLISLWPNCDGFKCDDPHTTPDENRYSSITRSFIQTGDDTIYVGGNQGGGNHLVSGCYLINLAGCLFRSFFGQYAGPNDYRGQKNHWFSAIDLDCRAYSVPSYNGLDKPLYETFFNSIFGINQTEKKRQWKLYYSDYSSVYITNHLFSGIRVENLIDVPVFDIGIRSYPETPGFDSATYDYTPVYGNISSIIFKDITVSSHPNSRYKWVKENKLIGSDNQYRPHDVSFINVNIDGQILTNVNKDDFFVWYPKPIPRDKDIGMISPTYAGSAVVDMYVIIGDSIAAAYDSKYADRTNTSYSALPSQITGCYIWVPSSTSFEVIKPGVNVPTNTYYANTGVTGVAGLECTLPWKARQYTGDRDIYVVKYAQGGALFVSAASATWASTQASPATNFTDWSVSSSGEMLSGLSATVNSAILSLSSQYKHTNLKAVIIAAGTNAPIQTANILYNSTYTVTSVNPYKNTTLVSSLINTEVSSFLISGLGQIFGTPRTETSLNYTKYIWILPSYEGEIYDSGVLNNYYLNLNNKIRSFSAPEYWESSLSSVLVPTRIIPYLPPTATYYRPLPGDVHYNFSGYAKITDDIYQILEQETSSVTDPTLNPDVNYRFSLSNGMKNWVKINGDWKEADTWVKQDGVWKFVTPSVKVSNNWK